MFDNIKNYGLIGLLILLPIISITSYQKGKSVGSGEIKQYYAKIELSNQQYYQNVINRLNESYMQTSLINQQKYGSLQNEFSKTSDNLAKCVTTTKQLQLIQRAANMQVPINTKSDNGIITSTITDSESGLTCQDMGLTMIEWSKIYFYTKAKLDYLQALHR